jgi:hypothetical protein
MSLGWRQLEKLPIGKIRQVRRSCVDSASMRTAGAAFICLLAGCVGADGVQGLDGIRGPMGPMGERGAAGPASTGYRPVYWASCGATLDLLRLGAAGLERGADGKQETSLNYALLVFNNGDAEVQCTAGIGSAQNGSASTYYPSTTKGSSSGLCIAIADIAAGPNTEAGYWSFDVVAGSGPRAAYNDPDNPLGLNGYSYKYSESDCKAQMMNDAGKWTLVTLADVF